MYARTSLGHRSRARDLAADCVRSRTLVYARVRAYMGRTVGVNISSDASAPNDAFQYVLRVYNRFYRNILAASCAHGYAHLDINTHGRLPLAAPYALSDSSRSEVFPSIFLPSPNIVLALGEPNAFPFQFFLRESRGRTAAKSRLATSERFALVFPGRLLFLLLSSFFRRSLVVAILYRPLAARPGCAA